MDKKMLPVGLDSFEKIRRLGYYYMDKTLLIQDVLTNRGDVNLFTRPRRFGKTLNMSMLWSFFEIGSDKSLFNGLAISEEKQLCEEYQARHPVVFLSLKGVEGLTYEEAIARLVTLISTECKRLDYLEKAPDVKEDDRKIFRNLMARQPEEDELQDALVTLMRMLHAHYGEQVILLIDEYDVPLDKAHINGYYDQMVAFLRGFFGEAFKTNPDLFFAVVTGCLRISKESIFTGINNLKVDTITDTRYDEYFGFTEADVKKLLADYGMEYALEDMRAWYDGYHFGNADVYCPWDVVNHCDKLLDNPKARPKPYWNNTSSNALVKQFIDMADATTRGEIEQLVAGKTIRKKIVETLTYGELTESIDNLWSVLFLTGYLTVDKNAPEDEDDYTSLVIPNREVREIFIEKIQKWFAEKVVTQKNSIGRLVYGDSNDSFKEWADMMMWDGTVTTELIPEEQLFTKVIGLSQQEYKLLRYKVRVQNQILGAVETMSYTALLNYPKTLAQYKASMEIALGKQLSDLEFERLWTDQYNAMSTASDYAHYNITKAAIFATDYPPFTFDVIEWIKRKLANQQTGGSDSTREDMAGWLGDATIRTNNGKVAFSPDDYMADLDADNVMNIMKTQNISHSEAEAIYFKRLENGETRAEIFLSHTSLDFVISEVLSRLNINSLEELKTIEPEAYAFIVSLEHGSNELEVVP